MSHSKALGILIFCFVFDFQSSTDVMASSRECRGSIAALVATTLLVGGCASSDFREDQLRGHIDGVPIVAADPTNFSIFQRQYLLNASPYDFEFVIADIHEASKIYPAGFLNKVLPDGVFIGVKNIKRRGGNIGQGGVNFLHPERLDLFLDTDGVVTGSPYITIFNHELGHSVLFQFGDQDFKARWKQLNPPDFSYSDSNRVDSLAGTRPDIAPDRYEGFIVRGEFMDLGAFVSNYARDSLQEDFAETSAIVFTPGFLSHWDEIQKASPIVAQKIKLVIELYHQADSRISFEMILKYQMDLAQARSSE